MDENTKSVKVNCSFCRSDMECPYRYSELGALIDAYRISFEDDGTGAIFKKDELERFKQDAN